MYYKDDKLKTSCLIGKPKITFEIEIQGEHDPEPNKKTFEWSDTIHGEFLEIIWGGILDSLKGYEEVNFKISKQGKEKTPEEVSKFLEKEMKKEIKDLCKRYEV